MDLEIYLYDKESEEAEILVKTLFGNFICFAHPFSGDLNTIDHNHFDVFLTMNAYVSDRTQCFITKNNDSYFAYSICGIKADDSSVTINEYVFELDEPLPKDVSNGQHVIFDCCRIDAIPKKRQGTVRNH